ncbi:MAG: hypothetical protein J7L92_06415 [Dehalococcoidia bacterium]|nr:hypothetical protein [Dehalococcoidia bacterium]
MRNSTVEVFAPDWVREVQRRSLHATKYTTPIIAKLALEPRFLNERNKIEKWFGTLPEDVKPDIQNRLRGESSHQHYGAYYELVLSAFFKELGYFVDIHPKLDEGEPDLLITGNSLEKPIVIEVATVFDDPLWQKEQRKLNQILERLARIEHYFLVHVSVQSDHIPEIVDYKALKQFVVQWLDSFDPKITHKIHKVRYKLGELKLELWLLPLKKPRKTSIVGGSMLPARFIGGQQLRRALEKKINKYKSVKKLEWPFVIAVSLADASPLDEENIIDELIGQKQVTITMSQDGKETARELRRDYGGLLTPKPGLGGRAQNRRLSAVIHIKSTWMENGEQRTRAHSVSVIHNHWADIPVNTEFLRGYPQLVCSSESDSLVTFDWVDRDSAMSFDC